jgi:hypothetical protein
VHGSGADAGASADASSSGGGLAVTRKPSITPVGLFDDDEADEWVTESPVRIASGKVLTRLPSARESREVAALELERSLGGGLSSLSSAFSLPRFPARFRDLLLWLWLSEGDCVFFFCFLFFCELGQFQRWCGLVGLVT